MFVKETPIFVSMCEELLLKTRVGKHFSIFNLLHAFDMEQEVQKHIMKNEKKRKKNYYVQFV